jgi:hypothetical protein
MRRKWFLAIWIIGVYGLVSCSDDGGNDNCEPDCVGRCCGADGCGGTCPDTCGALGGTCNEDSCSCVGGCTPQTCADLGKECGSWPDGCEGTAECGTCPSPQTCDENGTCQDCVPDCAGRCCGADGCGGTCPDACTGANGFCDVSQCTCTSVCDFQLHPTTPFRRLDTRSAEKLEAESETTFVVAERDGIPDDARMVVVRFTVVAPEATGHLTAWDAGLAEPPTTSVLNYAAGQTTGNTVFVKVGAEQKITVRTSAPTHLIVDVFGFAVEPEAFQPQTPYRLLDTRTGTKPAANSQTCVTAAGVNGVDADAKAAAVVVTAVAPEAAGSLVTYASGTTAPPLPTVSFASGQTTANGTIVEIGADQQICVDTTASSHIIVDVMGYFAVNAAYRPVPPYRKVEETHAAASTNCYAVAGVDSIPADAQAVALHLTAVNPSEPGFVTAYADGTQRPVASNLNFVVGATTTNAAIAKIGDNGQVCFYQHGAGRLQVDVVGYWPGMDSCCTGLNCETPPFIACSGTTDLITYGATGTCSRGTCDYTHSVTTCGYLCQQDSCVAAPSYPFHDRTEWQDPAYPVSSSSWMDINALSYITLHYIGADGVNLSDIPQFLRNAQLDYVVNRGYSLGYNSAVDEDGEEWEIRGFDYRCAANGTQATNIPSYSIVLLLPNTWSVPPTAQIDGVRNLVSKIRATAAAAGNGDFLEINGHRDLKPTSCPGDPIYTMIQNGTFEP